jgi:hypothetical protein
MIIDTNTSVVSYHKRQKTDYPITNDGSLSTYITPASSNVINTSDLPIQSATKFDKKSAFPNVDLIHGLQWKSLVEEMIQTIPMDQLKRETVDLYEALLRDFNRFYYCQLHDNTSHLHLSSFLKDEDGMDDDPNKWESFVNIQKVCLLLTHLPLLLLLL